MEHHADHSYFSAQKSMSHEAWAGGPARATTHRGRRVSCPLSVTVAIYRGTKCKLNIDNAGLKLLFDAMNGLVWEDDVQIEEMTVVKRYDKENPRIE